MNKLLIIVLAILYSQNIFAQVSNPIIIGTVKINDKAASGVNIRLIKNKTEIDNTTTLLNGKFTFTLSTEEQYIIEFQKHGCIFQRALISTKTQEKNNDGFLPFSFNVNMYQMFKDLDTSFFKKPVLKIKYNSKQKNFSIDELYQNGIKKDLEIFTGKLSICRVKAYNEEIKTGDQFYKNKEYEDAWLNFAKANEYRPEETYPKTKIAEIKKNLLQKLTKDQAYKRAIANGDKSFNNNNSNAHKFYEIALLYQPDSKYPAERIREIDEALDQFGFMKQQSMNNKLVQAENLFKNKKFEEALVLYKEAQFLSPGNQAILKRIEETKQQINKQYSSETSNEMKEETADFSKLLTEIALKEKAGDKKSASDLYVELGNNYSDQGSYNKSIDNFLKGLQLKEEIGDKKGTAALQQNVGDIYATAYNYEKAIEFYERTLLTKNGLNDNSDKEKILNKIGTMWFQQKQYNKAIEYFQQSLTIDEKKGDKKNFASSLNNIGVAYYESGNYEKAVENYEKALRVLEEIGSKKEISMSLNNLGNVSFDWKKFNKALEYYKKSLQYKEEIHYEKGIVISLYNIGKVYLETFDFKNAVTFFTNSRDIAEKIQLTPFVFMNNKALASVYYKLKEYKKAYEFLNEAKSTNESVFENDFTKQLSEIQFKYEDSQTERESKIKSLEKKVVEQNLWVQFLNEKKQRDDELYKRQTQIQKLKLRNEKVISYSLLAGFILLGFIAFIFYNRYKMKQKANTRLEKANDEINREKSKSDKLILNVLPAKVANDLKEKGKTEPELYKNVTVMFADIVGFTGKAAKHSPQDIINELNSYFSKIDEIIGTHSCERIKTIGDAYLAVCGMPIADANHIEKIALVALELIQYTAERNNSATIPWEIRIGIHTGEVVGGVVGIKKYVYDIFGDTINTTARMESACIPMKINVSEEIYLALKEKYIFTDRGMILAKGKGEMKMYFLESEKT